ESAGKADSLIFLLKIKIGMPKIGLFGLLYLFLIPFLVFSGQKSDIFQ
ncbi:MAG: hypothetical protein UY31_C0069G0001, partial [Candidatus Wolfebacteria bacterium GW2011_GWE1_48_7]